MKEGDLVAELLNLYFWDLNFLAIFVNDRSFPQLVLQTSALTPQISYWNMRVSSIFDFIIYLHSIFVGISNVRKREFNIGQDYKGTPLAGDCVQAVLG